MVEFFISIRYLRSKHKVNFISIISMISAIGVTIGVAALIIVISVFNGFGSLVKSILINFDPHVTVHVNNLSNEEQNNFKNFLRNNNFIESFGEFNEGKVLLQNNQNYQAITLKGITEQDTTNNWGIKTALLKGTINFNETDKNVIDMLVSQRMAIRLSVSVGDTIVINTFSN